MCCLDVGIQDRVGALWVTVSPTYHMQIPCCRWFLDFFGFTPFPEGQSQVTHDEIPPGIQISTWVGHRHADQTIQRIDTFGHQVLEDPKLNLVRPPGFLLGEPGNLVVYQELPT